MKKIFSTLALSLLFSFALFFTTSNVYAKSDISITNSKIAPSVVIIDNVLVGYDQEYYSGSWHTVYTYYDEVILPSTPDQTFWRLSYFGSTYRRYIRVYVCDGVEYIFFEN